MAGRHLRELQHLLEVSTLPELKDKPRGTLISEGKKLGSEGELRRCSEELSKTSIALCLISLPYSYRERVEKVQETGKLLRRGGPNFAEETPAVECLDPQGRGDRLFIAGQTEHLFAGASSGGEMEASSRKLFRSWISDTTIIRQQRSAHLSPSHQSPQPIDLVRCKLAVVS